MKKQNKKRHRHSKGETIHSLHRCKVLRIESDINTWTTDYKKVEQLTGDPELDSHVTFFNKFHTATQSLTGFELDDFDDLFKIKARAMLTADIK